MATKKQSVLNSSISTYNVNSAYLTDIHFITCSSQYDLRLTFVYAKLSKKYKEKAILKQVTSGCHGASKRRF